MTNAYVGEIRLFAGANAPAGWAFCDGRSLNRNSYLNLYSVIANTYGGSGESFNLPDLRGRVPVHVGTGPGLTQRSCGQSFGEEKVTLTEDNLPTHNHKVCLSRDTTATTHAPEGNYLADSVNFYMYQGRGAGCESALNQKTIEPSGSTSPHENMMPSLCINFIIALEGTFPSEAQE